MQKITINGIEYTINRQETKIGDRIVDKNNNTIYEASINDADDINWVIIE